VEVSSSELGPIPALAYRISPPQQFFPDHVPDNFIVDATLMNGWPRMSPISRSFPETAAQDYSAMNFLPLL
jgi:hypothetical protein